MKKTLIASVLGIVLAGGATALLLPSSAWCFGCAPKECSFDVQCGVGCWCYKGKHQIKGTCVPE